MTTIRKYIIEGKASLGIELGSTRIKGVLVNESNEPIASGDYEWENQLVEDVWTYSIDDVWKGIQGCYANLKAEVEVKYNVKLTKLASLGISGMMHGYMVFDGERNLLAPFRTWRNTITEAESEELTELFQYNIPQRWSITHLYQAIKADLDHVEKIRYMTTLAGYLHWMLSGERVLGVGEASGMFPIDIETKSYHCKMLKQFQEKVAWKEYPWTLEEILPKVLVAGETAGCLTEEGANLLDPTGELESGVLMCPPEGDAGTGMVATNSITERTANVSAGTSIFAMVVLEKELSKVYREIDMVTTPAGNLVAMAHCNNCTSDLNAWVGLFKEFTEAMGVDVDMNTLFATLYNQALEGDSDCGGLLAYNYLSGEHVTGLEAGRPMFVRTPESKFTLANFMRTHLFTTFGALKVGMDILQKDEKVQIDSVLGHGGIFKTKGVAQGILAGALNTPVSVMETAGEGGAWGIALLASYLVNKDEGETLNEFLKTKCFASSEGTMMEPQAKEVEGFERFMEQYQAGLAIEKVAVEVLK